MENWIRRMNICGRLFLIYTIIVFLYLFISSYDGVEGGIFAIYSALEFGTELWGMDGYPVELDGGGMAGLAFIYFVFQWWSFCLTSVLVLSSLVSLFIKPGKVSLILRFLFHFLVLGFLTLLMLDGTTLYLVPLPWWILMGYTVILMRQYWRLSGTLKDQSD